VIAPRRLDRPAPAAFRGPAVAAGAELVERRFKAPSPGVFRPTRNRFLQPATFGLSRLALQLVAVMLAGLALLLLATLSAASLRQGAADAVLRSLLVQSDAVVAALSGGEEVEDGPLLALAPAEPAAGGTAAAESGDAAPPSLVTTIDRSAVERRIGRVLEGSRSRARIFGIDGQRLADSSITLADAAAETRPARPASGVLGALWESAAGPFLAPDMPPEPEEGAAATAYPELGAALGGVKSAALRLDSDGDILVSVATPVLGEANRVVAALHLRSAEGAVTDVARTQEIAIVRVFLLAAVLAVVLSLLVSATINNPIRRLAQAADRIRRGGASTPMPELGDGGEVGELSRVLHDMTAALYARIDSIEAFAGEVAHELKNPLTSLRSAVETLPLARTDHARDQLLDVIQHDVRRIDRLISDISEASKLDAELNRHRYERFDLIALLRAVVEAQAEIATERAQSVEFVVRGQDRPRAFEIIGNDGRLSQVFTNLIDNARSFTPDGGRVVTTAQRFDNFIEVVVDDDGPGIAEDSLERIFERFYTDRSDQQSFGNNSGLGLAISRQIIEAHNGEIFAENRYRTTLGPDRDVAGARFTVRLPVVA